MNRAAIPDEFKLGKALQSYNKKERRRSGASLFFVGLNCKKGLVLDGEQGCHFNVVADKLTSFQSLDTQLDQEIDVDVLRMELFYEVDGSFHGTARSEKVVVDQYHVIFRNCVFVDLDGVYAVFLLIAHLDSLCWEFSWLATQYKTGTQTGSEHGTHYKASGLNAYDFGNALVLVKPYEFLKHFLDTCGVLEQRADIFELDARLGEVGDVSQILE